MADLTAIVGNPASRIQAQYSDLMNTACFDTLKAKALTIIEMGGVSKTNADKFRQTVTTQKNTAGLQKYLTNFMLKGAGLGLSAGIRGSRE